MIEVPYRFIRRTPPLPLGDGLLVNSADATTVLRYVLETKHDPFPQLFRVRNGFLILLRESAARTTVGAIRLRRLAGDFFIPVDADLSPSLLPDELVALTTSHGLVFLPSGEKLSFDPNTPVPIETFLEPLPIVERTWISLPPRPARAESLLILQGPEPTPVEILLSGQPDGSEPLPTAGEGDPNGTSAVPEKARPPAGSLGQRMKAGSQMGLGQILNWFGRALRLPGIAKAGADLVRRAIEQVPRLSEQILGQQEAALREVLRELREGDIERGLRRAPIAVPDPESRSVVSNSSMLSNRDPRYSLRDLIFSGGMSAGWLGGGDVWQLLAVEYRRLAAEAERKGDYRRAAYLHGVLLRDLHAAARMLTNGGLHRDAAILYRDRLGKMEEAALAFERAGDDDEALQLFLKLNDYLAAARIYRKLGYEEEAIDAIHKAANQFAGERNWLRAGDLMRELARDTPRATAFYRAGWSIPHPGTIGCGERLLDEAICAEAWDQVDGLLDDAAAMMTKDGPVDAGGFFNHALKLGTDFFPPAKIEQVRDRARLLFADSIRAEGNSSKQASARAEALFVRQGQWPGSVARDAIYAARRKADATAPTTRQTPTIELIRGPIRAVAVARGSLDIIVATDEEIVCWRVATGHVERVASAKKRKILGISTNPAATIVYALFVIGDEVMLESFVAYNHSFQPQNEILLGKFESADDWLISPNAFEILGMPYVFVQSAEKTMLLSRSFNQFGFWYRQRVVKNALMIAAEGNHVDVVRPLWLMGSTATYVEKCLISLARYGQNFSRIAIPPGSSLTIPSADWICHGPGALEIIAIDQEGILHWSKYEVEQTEIKNVSASAAVEAGFVGACLIRSGLVAAVDHYNELYWFRAGPGNLKPIMAPTKLGVPAQIVFLVCQPHTRELVALTADGRAARIDLV